MRPGKRRVAAIAAILGFAVYDPPRWGPSVSPPPEGTPAANPTMLTRLTFDDGLQTEPRWSPDGRFIAYSSNQSGNFEIWVQPVAGGRAIQVTFDPAADWQPDWSPDGRWVLFNALKLKSLSESVLGIVPVSGGAWTRHVGDFMGGQGAVGTGRPHDLLHLEPRRPLLRRLGRAVRCGHG